MNKKGYLIKKIILLLIVGLSLQATSISDYVGDCDKVIDKSVFKICYNYKAKGPNAVWYKLDSELINEVNLKKRPRFYNERNVPVKFRTKYKDYSGKHNKHYQYQKYNSRRLSTDASIVSSNELISYDRGHLANDADFDYDLKALNKTYSLANIVPQHSLINRKTWLKAEKYERLITKKLGQLIVINLVHYPKNPIRIGKDKIAVPDKFYKIMYNDPQHFQRCLQYNNYIRKIDVRKDNLKDHVIDCKLLVR